MGSKCRFGQTEALRARIRASGFASNERREGPPTSDTPPIGPLGIAETVLLSSLRGLENGQTP
jgi:hypothetical protein